MSGLRGGDDWEDSVRSHLRTRFNPDRHDVDALRDFVAALPDRPVRRRGTARFALAAAAVLALVAGGIGFVEYRTLLPAASATPSASATDAAIGTPTARATATAALTPGPTASRVADYCGADYGRYAGPAGGRTDGRRGQLSQQTVRWFVGLGSGTQPNQVADESDFVRTFNGRCLMYLQMEIVPNANAYDVLMTEIDGGNAPDIIGPVSTRGRNGLNKLLLDLSPLIAKHGPDLASFDPATLRVLDEPGIGRIGLPYLEYPGFVWYDKDLFAAAGLPDLPTRVGETYMGKPWTWDTLTEVARRLTLDSNGTSSTSPGFNATKISQWGMDFQWADGRRMASSWCGASFLAADGRTAQIPECWAKAWTWYHDAMWGPQPFAVPQGGQPGIQAACLDCGQSSTMATGHVAMDLAWAWSLPSIAVAAPSFRHWDIGVVPSYNGQTSSPLDVDTFSILNTSRVADEAYRIVLAIMRDPQLRLTYGGMPGVLADQPAYLQSLGTEMAKTFPDNAVHWSVITEMQRYPAIPSHEADMPGFLKAIDLYSTFYTQLQNDANLDVSAALARLRENLQQVFDESK